MFKECELMKNKIICLIIGLFLLAPVMTSGTSSFAAGDETGSWNYGNQDDITAHKGQSFIQGQTSIDIVEINFFGDTTGDVTLFLANDFDGNAPTGGEIEAQTSISKTGGSGWYTFTFSTNVTISASSTYWIVLNSTADIRWYASSTDPYADGQYYGLPIFDCGFRTFCNDVYFPEFDAPVLLIVLLSAIVGGIVLRNRHKQ